MFGEYLFNTTLNVGQFLLGCGVSLAASSLAGTAVTMAIPAITAAGVGVGTVGILVNVVPAVTTVTMSTVFNYYIGQHIIRRVQQDTRNIFYGNENPCTNVPKVSEDACGCCQNLELIDPNYKSVLVCPIDLKGFELLADKEISASVFLFATILLASGCLGYYIFKWYNFSSNKENVVVNNPQPPLNLEAEVPNINEIVNQIQENLQKIFQSLNYFLDEVSRQISKILAYIDPVVTDNTINKIEDQIFDNLFLEILQDPSLDHIIQQRITRELLEEILKKVEDVLTLHGSAMETTANIVSNFPSIP